MSDDTMYTERSLRDHKDWTKIEAVMTHDRLARHPEAQAEAIAHHYTRMAALSMDLLELVKIQKYGGVSVSTSEAIRIVTEDFREAHLKDLGIPLEWKCDETLYRHGN